MLLVREVFNSVKKDVNDPEINAYMSDTVQNALYKEYQKGFTDIVDHLVDDINNYIIS